jgi:hypothetical protein
LFGPDQSLSSDYDTEYSVFGKHKIYETIYFRFHFVITQDLKNHRERVIENKQKKDQINFVLECVKSQFWGFILLQNRFNKVQIELKLPQILMALLKFSPCHRQLWAYPKAHHRECRINYESIVNTCNPSRIVLDPSNRPRVQ